MEPSFSGHGLDGLTPDPFKLSDDTVRAYWYLRDELLKESQVDLACDCQRSLGYVLLFAQKTVWAFRAYDRLRMMGFEYADYLSAGDGYLGMGQVCLAKGDHQGGVNAIESALQMYSKAKAVHRAGVANLLLASFFCEIGKHKDLGIKSLFMATSILEAAQDSCRLVVAKQLIAELKDEEPACPCPITLKEFDLSDRERGLWSAWSLPVLPVATFYAQEAGNTVVRRISIQPCRMIYVNDYGDIADVRVIGGYPEVEIKSCEISTAEGKGRKAVLGDTAFKLIGEG